jgi:hypothetical protein
MSKEQLKPTQEQPEVIQVRSEKKRGIHYPTKAEISAGFQTVCDQYGLKPDDYLPEIAKITMKGVSYLSLQTDSKNTLSLSLEVANMLELDKFLQTLNSPLINKYFRDVKLGSISREQKDASEFLKVDVILSFNPTIIQYKPADNQAVK